VVVVTPGAVILVYPCSWVGGWIEGKGRSAKSLESVECVNNEVLSNYENAQEVANMKQSICFVLFLQNKILHTVSKDFHLHETLDGVMTTMLLVVE